MRVLPSLQCAALLAAMLFCPFGASAQEGVRQDVAPHLADFNQTGHPEVRRMLHGRPRAREVRAYRGKQPAGMSVRELVAVEPVAARGDELVLATYEGLYLCGAHGCLLEALRRDADGRWRVLLQVVSQPGLVGLGPESSHGLADIVLPGDHSVDYNCAVWRFNGAQYRLDHLMNASQELCRKLNGKDDPAD